MSSLDQSLERREIVSSRRSVRSLPFFFSLTKIIPEKLSLPVIASMSVASALLVPSRMLLSRGEPDDSSVFAYIGWAMKHGLMPYRDVWDHKGPLLYYLNFAGMSLRSTSTLGVGLLELVALAFAFFLIYRLIASFASVAVGIVVAAFSVAYVTHFYAGGNMTESWALLPLAAAHYACWRWSQRLSESWCAPAMTACLVCIFFLRPNMIVYPAIGMVALLYAIEKNIGVRALMKQFALACATALGLSALILAPLYRWGVFHDFLAAYFGYNAAYSGALSLAGRYLHTSQLLMLLFATAIAIFGTAGWALAIRESRHKNEVTGGIPSLYLLTLLWSLPFEIAGASLSGRDYPHYLLPLFPTLVVLAAWFLSEFEKQTKTLAAGTALALTLWLGLCPFAVLAYLGDFSRSTEPPRSDFLAVADFIQHATTPDDKITVIETAYITFLAQRLPGSRFVYQLPLIDVNNPVAGEQRKQFVCDIAHNRPAVIVSSRPLFGVLCATPLDCPPQNPEPAAEYGYDFKLMPQILQKIITSDYRPISDPRFGSLKVLVRKDLAIPAHW